jgi:hypothetical protein
MELAFRAHGLVPDIINLLCVGSISASVNIYNARAAHIQQFVVTAGDEQFSASRDACSHMRLPIDLATAYSMLEDPPQPPTEPSAGFQEVRLHGRRTASYSQSTRSLKYAD